MTMRRTIRPRYWLLVTTLVACAGAVTGAIALTFAPPTAAAIAGTASTVTGMAFGIRAATDNPRKEQQ